MNMDKSGQGIGFFMVKKLVDPFKGTIAIESEVGAGTTGWVRLPLLQNDLPASTYEG
jgi:signal transduction histidine kinase